jgi:signal transduction histidine kinase
VGCLFFGLSEIMAKKLILTGKENENVLRINYLSGYEDKKGHEFIGDIIKKEEERIISFSPLNKASRFFTKSPNSTYWFKIEVKNNSSSNGHYILESYNYRIDTFSVYETSNGKIINADSIGVAYNFGKRDLKHKNLTYSFWMDAGEERVIYIKIKSRYETPVELVLRELEYFTSYALTEYFFLGLFYGSILIIILLNIMAGAYLKSMTHYFYVFYVCSVGIFFLCQDGIGFQYVWPNLQSMNDYAYMVSVSCITIFLLLYTNSFLNLKIHHPFYTKVIYWYISLRLIILIINMKYFPEIRHMLYIDMIPFFLAYYCGYLSFRSGYSLSKYFMIGCSILIAGFMLNFMQLFGLLGINIYTFYFVNLCFLLEMIIFYLTLAERMRFYKQQKEISTELKKIIEDKEQLIEQFTYKTSHDLSGPVKTILGVAHLALTENNGHAYHSYIKMIQATAQRLDDVLKSIAEINIIRAQAVERTVIDTAMVLERVMSNNKINEYSESIKIKIEDQRSGQLEMDSSILYTMISNLLIYQLTCLQHKIGSGVHINVQISDAEFIIETFNPEVKIPVEYHKEIFKIFFRLSNENNDIGTYLYLVELCIDKLGGTIQLRNSGNTTYFKISIPL